MKAFTLYDQQTGQIVSSGFCPEEHFQLQKGSFEIIEGTVNDSTQYIVNGEVVDRPTLPEPVADRWEGLPVGCEILFNDVSHGVNEDTWFELDTDIPGTHRLEIRPPFPYVAKTWEIVIDEAVA